MVVITLFCVYANEDCQLLCLLFLSEKLLPIRTWCLNLNSLANDTFHCLRSHLPFREISFPLMIIRVFWKDRLHTRTFREKAKEHHQKSLSKNICLKLVVNYSWNLLIILKYLIK